MSRDIREQRPSNSRPQPPPRRFGDRPVNCPIVAVSHDTGHPNRWDDMVSRPGYHITHRFTSGKSKLTFYTNYVYETDSAYYGPTLIFSLVLVDTRLSSNEDVNGGHHNNYLFELLHHLGQKRDWQYDPRTRKQDGNIGYLFRDPQQGGFRMANAKLQVCFT